MKKKFLPSFDLPRLVLGKSRTYINVYYYDKKGVKHHKKPTFNLNRILNLHERERRGREIEKKLHWWLNQGYDLESFDERKVDFSIKKTRGRYESMNIMQALDKAEELKCNSEREKTNKSYRSHINRLKEWLEQNNYHTVSVGDFDNILAREYMDYYQFKLKRRNTTVNNVFIHQRSIWYALKERGYCNENPFKGWKKLRPQKKIRSNISREDASTIIKHIYKENRILFYAIVLEYACAIRPSEMVRLRFENFYVTKGLIFLEGRKTKNWNERYVRIPNDFLNFFKESYWTNYPARFFVFGEKFQPNGKKAAHDQSLSKAHRKIINKLYDDEKISDKIGYQFYSWKDTGITDIIKQLGAVVAKDHADHKDLKTTMRYYHAQKGNPEMKKMKNPFFED